MKLLLEERNQLMSLAREGCIVNCIISPANENHIQHAGIKYAVTRTQRLLGFMKSEREEDHKTLKNINWAISEPGTKNLYVIGHVSCIEGYRKRIGGGYELTLRQTSSDVIEANIEIYRHYFKDLHIALLVAATTKAPNKEMPDRELVRLAVIERLEESLNYLKRLEAASMELFSKSAAFTPGQ